MRRVAVLSGRPPRNEASIEAMRATAQRLAVELTVIEADSPRAAYVVQILRGTPPGELPIETPTHFESVVNKKTAASLGVDLPPETLIRADEVIE
jgi:ABC-type uncharacterized transport system substrate-binding protein